MSEERFDIFFAGECLDGHDQLAVREALGKLFKADPATLDRLFSGGEQRIKRDSDRSTALNYQKAMASAGARVIIRQVNAPASTPEPSAAAAESPVGTEKPQAMPDDAGGQTGTGESQLRLTPAGSDVLRPDERRDLRAASIDVSHLSLAASGEQLGPDSPASIPSAAVPDFELAAVGTDLGEAQRKPAIATPDLSSFSLAPADHDLTDCAAPAPPAPAMDLDHLAIAEPGAELLRDDERQRIEARVPDTRHIELEAPHDSQSLPKA